MSVSHAEAVWFHSGSGCTAAPLAALAPGTWPIAGGSRIIVADANLHRLPGVPSNLAVISTASALGGRPALLGYIRVGAVPREFAVEPGGKTILVTVQGAHELIAVDVGGLP